VAAKPRQSSKRKWLFFYWLAILFVWLLWAFQLILSYLDDVRDPYPATTLLIALLLSSVIVAYRWAVESMAAFGSDIEQLVTVNSGLDGTKGKKWYASEFDEIFNWTKSAGFTVFFTVLALFIARKIEVASWFPSGTHRIVAAVPYMMIGSAFGACLWPGYRMSVFVYRLASKIHRLNPFASTNRGIFKIGRTLVKFEAVGVGLILLFGAAFLESPYRLSNRAILYSATITSLVWMFWFFFTQSQIHRAMVNYKREKQDWFSEYYENKLSAIVNQPDRDELEELPKLILLKKEIESIPVWPFDTGALLTSVGLILTPIIGAVIQRFIAR
jgi:hypothetical protein